MRYDELRVGVTRGDGSDASLVSPETNGRFLGPFHPGDQDLYVYLRDDLGGVRVRCDITALLASTITARGEAVVAVRRHSLEDVAVLMGTAGGWRRRWRCGRGSRFGRHGLCR